MNLEPPWVKKPEADFWWGGWRQGNLESFMIAWLEQWQKMNASARVAYLKEFPVPNEDWMWWLEQLK
jgi:hypothetical protein